MRANGILLHLSSLPSPYGIGTMGRCAYEFVDFLASGGQTYWQILPACPTTYGDSPYQSFSVYAGNPYFIDLDMLAEEGLLKPEEYQQIEWSRDTDRVDYGILYEKRFDVLRLAAGRFLTNPAEDYALFCEENQNWLSDYALFMTLKTSHQGAPWWTWETEDAERAGREQETEMAYWKTLQYLFSRSGKN